MTKTRFGGRLSKSWHLMENSVGSWGPGLNKWWSERDMFTCIVSIVTEEEETFIKDVSAEELTEFMGDLPVSALEQMREFFQTMPYVEHKVEYTCPHCETDQTISINGYEHFFA